MARLNLTTNGKEQERIFAYLEANASDVLADKINNGVQITKDNKQLINKKDLKGFIRFAGEEARKQSEKGSTCACVEDDIVFGWAIHYFEEDSIEGTLYNLDGTEYKVVKQASQIKSKSTENRGYSQNSSKKKQQDSNIQQQNFFDLMNEEQETETDIDNAVDNSEFEENELDNIVDDTEIEQVIDVKPEKQISSIYQKYLDIQKQYPNSVVAYRLGDFYEVFGENAKIIASELDLTLTGRDCGLYERVPMIGFPYHAADMYFSKIIQNGHRLAVAEDLNSVREIVTEKYKVEEQPQVIVSGNQIIDKETGEILNEEVRDNEQAFCVFNEYEQIVKDLLGEQLIIKWGARW